MDFPGCGDFSILAFFVKALTGLKEDIPLLNPAPTPLLLPPTQYRVTGLAFIRGGAVISFGAWQGRNNGRG